MERIVDLECLESEDPVLITRDESGYTTRYEW